MGIFTCIFWEHSKIWKIWPSPRTFYVMSFPVGRKPTVLQHNSATLLQSNLNPVIYTFLYCLKSILWQMICNWCWHEARWLQLAFIPSIVDASLGVVVQQILTSVVTKWRSDMYHPSLMSHVYTAVRFQFLSSQCHQLSLTPVHFYLIIFLKFLIPSRVGPNTYITTYYNEL
jgi:hypothetical protein